ncbi:hypothetical protein GCM10022244_29470 [Streptomyces gulbargensis]|uniref:Uncharacterized protein n=1 Tax=Streptomyces gulbargensis TaxID=364901 RepID=A0ABP7MDF5_9ACTN
MPDAAVVGRAAPRVARRRAPAHWGDHGRPGTVPRLHPGQITEEERLRRLLTDLSEAVGTHPYGDTLEVWPARVAALWR